MPHELTSKNSAKEKKSNLALLRDQRKDNILDRTVSCDEKWLYYNNTSCKRRWSSLGKSAGLVTKHALIIRRCSLHLVGLLQNSVHKVPVKWTDY